MKGLLELSAGQELHQTTEAVASAELILSGTLTAEAGGSRLVMGPGLIIGMMETPGASYRFNYKATSDAKVYAYDYSGEADLVKIIRSNARIAPAIAAQTVRFAPEAYDRYTEAYDLAGKDYQAVMSELKEYPILAAKAGKELRKFPELHGLDEPEDIVFKGGWQQDYLVKLKEDEAFLLEHVFTRGTEAVTGVAMTLAGMLVEIAQGFRNLIYYRSSLAEKSKALRNETALLRMQVKAAEDELDEAAGAEDGEDPVITDALDTILIYSGIDGDKVTAAKELLDAYRKVPDRTDTDDGTRRMRKKIADLFYEVYYLAFLKSRQDPGHVPPAVRMFFLTGFMDERLAGEKNTAALYRIMKQYHPDPAGNVHTIYEWLVRIYEGKSEPSRNEFDQDYPAYLRDQRQNGEITEAEEQKYLKDRKRKMKFELDNLFRLGNRMTFGRISSFQPVFDEQNVTVDLFRGYLSPEKLHEALDRVRAIDFTCFYRDRDFTDEDLGVSHATVHKEVLPNLILFPNVGSRAALWQEIEGKRRDTPARMMLPIFLADDLDKSMVNLAGEFRWEMTKTEQGVHWNDLSDPSLTAEYADYIQYYRKNHDLSADQKEKVKKVLQKTGNNLRRTFVTDYMVYMNSESNGSPLMNRVTRRILFTYCPFSASIREKLKTSPQYTELLQRFETKTASEIRPIVGIIHRLEKEDKPVPEELSDELEKMKR